MNTRGDDGLANRAYLSEKLQAQCSRIRAKCRSGTKQVVCLDGNDAESQFGTRWNCMDGGDFTERI